MVSTLSPEPHQIFKKNCVFFLKMNLFVRKIWELQIVCGAEISSKFLWLQHLNHNAHRSISYSLEPCTSAQLGDDGKLYHLVERYNKSFTTRKLWNRRCFACDHIFLINRSTLLKWKRQLWEPITSYFKT